MISVTELKWEKEIKQNTSCVAACRDVSGFPTPIWG